MSQDWAVAFYASRAWEETRRAYGDSVLWICGRCERRGILVPGVIIHHKVWLTPTNVRDPWVALCWDNLECLCHDCHDDEHLPRVGATRPGYAFDINGNLIALESE